MDGDALFVGLISGTSADGIDAALVDLASAPRVVAARTVAFEPGLRARILELAQDPDAAIAVDALGRLDAELGAAFAAAATALLQEAGVGRERIVAIGSHGQTLRHRPGGPTGFSLQLGDPARIAEATGIDTVADFRRRDLAAGGQGAPLVPAFHAACFADPAQTRAVLNLGGIANLTLLPAGRPTGGFDTGPANALLDAWAARHTGAAFDADGRFAAGGTVLPALLDALMAEPYFTRPPPKSTGREDFNLAWLERYPIGDADPRDVQATLLELTAASIAEALQRWLAGAETLIACGGGVHNRALMHRLAERVAPVRLTTSAAYGIDPDFVEAAAFAWLARETLAGRPGNVPAVTGAAKPRILGAIHRA